MNISKFTQKSVEAVSDFGQVFPVIYYDSGAGV